MGFQWCPMCRKVRSTGHFNCQNRNEVGLDHDHREQDEVGHDHDHQDEVGDIRLHDRIKYIKLVMSWRFVHHPCMFYLYLHEGDGDE